MTCLLDTNVLSEFTKRQIDAKVLKWWNVHKENGLFYISAVTIGEIQYGISRLQEGSARRKRLEQWLEDEVMGRFGERIIPYTQEVALVWGRIIAAQEGVGMSKPDLDMQLAATAICHNLTLVTRNVDDFAVPGLKVVNPFA